MVFFFFFFVSIVDITIIFNFVSKFLKLFVNPKFCPPFYLLL